MSAKSVPIQRRMGEPPERERIQVQPRPPIQMGTRKLLMPIACNIRSLITAPKGPIQLRAACVATGSVEVFSEGSVACQVASERNRSAETNKSNSPRKMFTGRLRVGSRTMRVGFI